MSIFDEVENTQPVTRSIFEEVEEQKSSTVSIFDEVDSVKEISSKEELPPLELAPKKPEGVTEELKQTFNKVKFTEEEIAKLAKRYKKDARWVKDAILAEGGDFESTLPKDTGFVEGIKEKITSPEAWSDFLAGTIGEAQSKFALGLPRKWVRMSAPKEDRKYLDEIAEQVRARESAMDIAVASTGIAIPAAGTAKSVAPLLSNLPKTKKVIDIATPGVLGGIAGFGTSKEGEEIQGALMGTALGVATQAGMKYWHTKLSPKMREDITGKVIKAKEASEEFINGTLKTLKGQDLTDVELDGIVKELKLKPSNIKSHQASMAKKGLIMSESDAARSLAKQRIDSEIVSFGRQTLKAEYPDMKLTSITPIKENVAKQMAMSQEEEAFISLLYDRHRTVKTVKDLVSNEVISKYSPSEANAIKGFMDNWSSAQQTLARADSRWGTKSERYLHTLSDDYMKYQAAVTRAYNDYYSKMFDVMKHTTGDRTQIYKYIEDPKLDIPPELSEAVESTRVFFNNMKKELESLGISVETVKDYFTRRTKSPEDLRASIEKQLKLLQDEGVDIIEVGLKGKKFQERVGPLTEKQATEATKGMWEGEKELLEEMELPRKRASEILTFLEDFTGRPIKSNADIASALNDISTMSATGGLDNYLAGSLRKRVGSIPDFAREKDPLKVAQTYMNSVFKTALMRDSIAKLTTEKKLLEAVGDIEAANYIQDIVDNSVGRKRLSSISELQNLKSKKQQQVHFENLGIAKKQAELEAMKEGVTDQARLKEIQSQIDMLEVEKEGPIIGEVLANLMYSNSLGWAYDKPLRNMSQPFVLTATEIGGLEGQKIVGKAFMKSMTNAREIAERLGKEGKLVGKFKGDYVKDIADELSKTNEFKKRSRKAVEKYAEIGLWLYSKSDTWNRVVTSNVAELMAADYKAGKKYAVDFVKNKMSTAYKNALRTGEVSTQQAIEDFLLARTQFQYTKVALGKYARDMPALFRVFTKWPTEITGDIYTKLYDIGDANSKISKVFNKYLGPYAMFAMYDKYYSDKAAESPRAQVLMGKTGKLAPKMPVSNVFGLTKGELLSNPHVQTIQAIGSNKMLPAFGKVMQYYGPFGPVDQAFRTYQFFSGEEQPKVSKRIIESLKD